MRKPIQATQKFRPLEQLPQLEARVMAQEPTKQIYEFEGFFQVGSEHDGQKEPLSLENTMWCNTILASSGFVFGLVLYTGIDTRS